MSSMTYPPLVHDAATPAAWLQRSVHDYFSAIAWVPLPVSPIAPPADAAPPNSVPLSLDLSVVQYFANLPWSGVVAVPVVAASEPIGPELMLDPAAIADWLDFAPTVNPEARPTKAALADSGSLADFSDFF